MINIGMSGFGVQSPDKRRHTSGLDLYRQADRKIDRQMDRQTGIEKTIC